MFILIPLHGWFIYSVLVCTFQSSMKLFKVKLVHDLFIISGRCEVFLTVLSSQWHELSFSRFSVTWALWSSDHPILLCHCSIHWWPLALECTLYSCFDWSSLWSLFQTIFNHWFSYLVMTHLYRSLPYMAPRLIQILENNDMQHCISCFFNFASWPV